MVFAKPINVRTYILFFPYGTYMDRGESSRGSRIFYSWGDFFRFSEVKGEGNLLKQNSLGGGKL